MAGDGSRIDRDSAGVYFVSVEDFEARGPGPARAPAPVPKREPAPAITLYIQPGFQIPGHPRFFSGSPFVVKVERLLRYKRLPFETQEVGWLERAERLPALSASRKLPVLEYDGERVEDSSAIAYFIEARHPTPPLVPADPLRRARCHFLEEWADEVLYWYGVYEQRRVTKSDVVDRAYFADLPAAVQEAAAERIAADVEENLSRQGIGRYPAGKVKADVRRGLDSLCVLIDAQGYLAGSTLSLADLAVFGQLHRRLAGSNPWLETEIAKRPSITAWLERVDRLTRE